MSGCEAVGSGVVALRRGDVSSEAAYEAHGVTRLLCVRENNAPHCGADS